MLWTKIIDFGRRKIYPNMVMPLVTGKQLGSTALLSFFRIPDIIVLHDLFT